MVAGEPGSGKTTLCLQLASSVRARSGLVLVGHCPEAGLAGMPYQPFVEALGAYASNRESESLYHDFGSGLSEIARLVAQMHPEDSSHRCDLRLAEALTGLGETERVIESVAAEAVELAEELADPDRAFSACRIAIESLDAHGAGTATARKDYAMWAQKARSWAAPGSAQSAHALLAQANVAFAQGRVREAERLRRESLQLGGIHRDAEILYKSAFYLWLHSAPWDWGMQRFDLVEESRSWAHEGVSAHSRSRMLFYSGSLELARGDRIRAEELWNRLDPLIEETQAPTARMFSFQSRAVLAITDGRLEEAVAVTDRFRRCADELGSSTRGRHLSLLLLQAPLIFLGRAQEWLARLQEFGAVEGSDIVGQRLLPYQAACLAHLGRLDEARALVGAQLEQEAANTGDSDRNANLLMYLFETAVLVGDRRAAASMARRVELLASLSTGDWFYTCPARHLGAAAALCEDSVGARRYYEQALLTAGKISFRPEIALTHLQLAELLLASSDLSDRLEARQHLDYAIGEFRQMHMQPALDRALGHVAEGQVHVSSQRGRRTTPDALTPREYEVVQLIGVGRTNREIAELLVISEGTVEVHLKHIFRKLGARSRVQVATWIAHSTEA
jgi:DNA-binding CsgD family transcriptional regulator/tetratricopeptide (TPR) repeat protein